MVDGWQDLIIDTANCMFLPGQLTTVSMSVYI
jgi:hypothetical protein